MSQELADRVSSLLQSYRFCLNEDVAWDYADYVAVARADKEFQALGEATLGPLIEALSSKDADTRSAAACAAKSLGPIAASAVPALVQLLATEPCNAPVKKSAIYALASIGERAVIPLVEAFLSENKEMKEGALEAITLLKEKAAPAVPAILAACEGKLGTREIMAFGEIGPEARASIPYLLAKLESGDWQSAMAREAVCRIGSGAIPDLIAATRHCVTRVRWVAADAIGRAGPAAIPALPALLQLLSDKEEPVRSSACRALENVGSLAKGLLNQIIPALKEVEYKDHSLAVRTEAILALISLAPSDVFGLSSGADREKACLALINTCLEWPVPEVSTRKIADSNLLKSHRLKLGLCDELSEASVRKQFNLLSRFLQVESLLEQEPKRQFSVFSDGIIDKLKPIKRVLETRVQEDAEQKRREMSR